MIKRPILLACIGYIVGIIYGLYFKSIAPFFIALIVVFALYRFLNKKIKRYIKVVCPIKAVLIVITAIIIAYISLNICDYRYEQIYKIDDGTEVTGVVEELEIKKYSKRYIVDLKTINNKEYTNLKIILIAKNNLEIGDYIKLNAKYMEPDAARNYKGFSYKDYLKQENIVGTIKPTSEILVLKKQQINFVVNVSNKLKNWIKTEFDANMSKNNSGVFLGILLGDKSDISKEEITDFKQSSMMHILAVSGAHVSYVIMIFSMLLSKISKRKYLFLMIAILIFFMVLTSFTPSVVRAFIMAILMLTSKIIYEKSDTYINICLSCLVLLIYNPYNILNIGFQLSFLGTLGIMLLSPKILEFIENKFKLKIENISKIKKAIISAITISISVQIMIVPIIIINFNMLTFTFLISSIISIPIFAGIMMVGIFTFILFPLRFILFKILNILINILVLISKFISNIPFLTYTVTTPNVVFIIVYYLILFLYILVSNKLPIRIFKSKSKLKKIYKKMVVALLIISLIFQLFQIIDSKNLRIYFIDVGQGDSCLIITKSNKTILIDGGGSTDENYDIGEKVLVPYLLDRGVKTIDYIMVSHFDNDHCGGLMYVLQKLKVKNIIISKQVKISKEYEKFMSLVKEKKINIVYVKAGNILKIDNEVRIYILYPFNELAFDDLNNNSIVAKLFYKDFSVLFTGDIEQEAEKIILDRYDEISLKSTIIKAPHHGSKTSSTEEFICTVKPKIALIGVGKDNKFGHPNGQVLGRYKAYNVEIYRTDETGEISIEVKNNGRYKIKKYI